ncbi:MAG: uncharacterized protein KVP18_001434 [Porospora cf. gigantea A]|uniref:uncharacterized protein n=1 Tax=Porospora cf. gigantea A TaxID=2853593 RepID=UPI00355A83D5|nr:MAG: hypothetical protein KVP18_001434 [Porospora cf. gigantea A]
MRCALFGASAFNERTYQELRLIDEPTKSFRSVDIAFAFLGFSAHMMMVSDVWISFMYGKLSSFLWTSSILLLGRPFLVRACENINPLMGFMALQLCQLSLMLAALRMFPVATAISEIFADTVSALATVSFVFAAEMVAVLASVMNPPRLQYMYWGGNSAGSVFFLTVLLCWLLDGEPWTVSVAFAAGVAFVGAAVASGLYSMDPLRVALTKLKEVRWMQDPYFEVSTIEGSYWAVAADNIVPIGLTLVIQAPSFYLCYPNGRSVVPSLLAFHLGDWLGHVGCSKVHLNEVWLAVIGGVRVLLTIAADSPHLQLKPLSWAMKFVVGVGGGMTIEAIYSRLRLASKLSRPRAVRIINFAVVVANLISVAAFERPTRV